MPFASAILVPGMCCCWPPLCLFCPQHSRAPAGWDQGSVGRVGRVLRFLEPSLALPGAEGRAMAAVGLDTCCLHGLAGQGVKQRQAGV